MDVDNKQKNNKKKCAKDNILCKIKRLYRKSRIQKTKNNERNRFGTCVFEKYKGNKSNIYNNTNNRMIRYKWRILKKIWKRKSIHKNIEKVKFKNIAIQGLCGFLKRK